MYQIPSISGVFRKETKKNYVSTVLGTTLYDPKPVTSWEGINKQTKTGIVGWFLSGGWGYFFLKKKQQQKRRETCLRVERGCGGGEMNRF